jgi:cytochrome P450
MNDEELISNLYTFMIAGHETSATALAWTLWLLAHDQTSQQRVRDEIQTIVGDRDIAVEDVEKLIFTRQTLQESMRLFPPAIGVGRAPIEDIDIGPHKIRAGELAIIAGWCVHRHEKLWDDPNGFDPDRFSPERAKSRHRCAYLPFGAGPRICIGMNFAMLEMIVILATLTRQFRFSLLPGHHIELATNLTLRSKNGLPLNISPL